MGWPALFLSPLRHNAERREEEIRKEKREGGGLILHQRLTGNKSRGTLICALLPASVSFFLPQLNKRLTVTAWSCLQPAHITHTTHAHHRLSGNTQSDSRFWESSGFLIQSHSFFFSSLIAAFAYDHGSFHMRCWLWSVWFKSSFPRLQ